MKRTLAFFGAFNPPTKAHIDLAEFAMNVTGRDDVIFVPSKMEYIRYEQKKDFAFSDASRIEMLKRIDGKYLDVDKNELAAFAEWVEKGSLSHKAVAEEYEIHPTPLLKKIVDWSYELNQRISMLTPKDKPPFENGKEALEYALGRSDIAIISSSNMAAIVEEWKAHDLIKYVDVITSQEIGSKNQCIATMLKKGYEKQNILMIGDAYPDVDAAQENGVCYYPILTRHEAESWQEFIDRYFDLFMENRYDVIVIGAGHAGIEAGLAAARLGCKTLLTTLSLENLAMMPCNPSIGGSAKGHLVREVDALGGQMGIAADKTCIQYYTPDLPEDEYALCLL